MICVNYLLEKFRDCHFLSSLIISIVPNSIALDSVMMKGILLIYIISMVSVTLPCSFSIPSGRSSNVLSITLDRVFLVDLSFQDPRFVPIMSSSLRMLRFVIGQFGIRPFYKCSIYFLVVGLPIMSCIEHALRVLAYSLNVNLFIFESTVLIMTCAMSFLTSETYKPILGGKNTQLVPSALGPQILSS